MGLSFLTSAEQTIEVVVTCDPSIDCTEEQRAEYLETGDMLNLRVADGATIFTLKALSPAEREQAEIKAGAMTRSELGRLLWTEAPDDLREKATWHHKLSDDEREAMSQYQQYLNNVYSEMIRASLISIDEANGSLEQIQMIRPESHRVQTISELVLHIQRISLLGDEGK
tara:strand:- start:5618 stop:6127 length:510 start_codon:yes stop_codon:yes gene_type:complete